MSKEFKPLVYYYIRRGWFTQQLKFCESIISKKGKEPLVVFWKAFALGMSGRVKDSIRELSQFESKTDMKYPVTLALHYFHQRSERVDDELISKLSMELSVAEEVTVRYAKIIKLWEIQNIKT